MDPLHAEIEHLKLKIELLEEEKKNIQTINEDLNLELKYSLFDAEAFSRENKYLRKIINDNKDK